MSEPTGGLFTDADLSDESASASVENLPGYGANSSGLPPDTDNGDDDQSVPGAGLNTPVQGLDFGCAAADITTAADPGQLRRMTEANDALPGDLMRSLRESVTAADRQAQQSALAQPAETTGFNPLAPAPSPEQQQRRQQSKPWWARW